MRVVDLWSDTATVATPEMRRAMAEADVGDDSRGEDLTTKRLEALAADMTGKDASIFVASCTMANLIAILAHCQRGDEVLVGEQSHIFRNEEGGASALGGVSYRTLKEDDHGRLDPDELEAALTPDGIHHARTAMAALENTHNLRAGAALTAEYTSAAADVAHRRNIPLHVDGARLFNAAVRLGTPASELVEDADSVAVSLSKGLGAPIGAVLCGSNELVDAARRYRKTLGGEMRKIGVVAAAGIVALETMVERLAEDHSNARKLALGLTGVPGISIDPDSVHTNLVYFDVTANDPAELARRLEERGVKGGTAQRRWRFVPHYGISADDIDYALDAIDTMFRHYHSR